MSIWMHHYPPGRRLHLQSGRVFELAPGIIDRLFWAPIQVKMKISAAETDM